jgi:hypothetical protein
MQINNRVDGVFDCIYVYHKKTMWCEGKLMCKLGEHSYTQSDNKSRYQISHKDEHETHLMNK